jgi:hypothetical protein
MFQVKAASKLDELKAKYKDYNAKKRQFNTH